MFVLENISDIGHHTLQLKTIVSDSNASTNLKSLPSLDVAFVVTEAEAHKFTVGVLETPLRVGVPFQVLHICGCFSIGKIEFDRLFL